jgi:hypothetical protein
MNTGELSVMIFLKIYLGCHAIDPRVVQTTLPESRIVLYSILVAKFMGHP